MDPRDDLGSLAGGVGCAACGEVVPTDRIRILARRDDLVFVEVACPGCRSESLGIVVTADDDDRDGVAVMDPIPYAADFVDGEAERFRDEPPIAAGDVEIVRRLLADGDLSALVGGSEPPGSGTAR